MTSSGGGDFPASLLLVGAGKMGGAFLQGWLDLGLEPGRIHVARSALLPRRCKLFARRAASISARRAAPPDVLVLAVKPQILDERAPELAQMIGPRR